MTVCPICLSVDGFPCTEGETWGRANVRHTCEVCGIFGTTLEAREDFLGAERQRTTRYSRASLSHWTRERQAKLNRDDIPVVTTELVEAAIADKLSLPNPAEQAINIIRFVGEETRLSGEGLPFLPPKFHAIVGSVRREFACNLVSELVDQGKLAAIDASDTSGYNAIDVRLTLSGWNIYESELKGEISGNYGFIALKFNDSVLDPFLSEHIRPAIQSLGMDLRDMRDNSQAGIIDNLMRSQIRDAAFVLVDLTHDNPGAYWEAGYAEGLGKPVLYICEKAKFDAAKTHFDTNHCTTVLWDNSNPEEFRKSLIATLQRSLLG